MDSYHQFTESSNAAFDQKDQFNSRIKEIETRLDRGCYYFYQIYILFLIATSMVSLFASLIIFIVLLASNGSDGMIEGLIFIVLPLYFTGLIYQKWTEYKAITDRDLAKANKAVKLIIYLVAFFIVLFAVSFYFALHDRNMLEMLLSGVSGPATVMIISIIGACKIQGKLEERQRLLDSLKSHDILNSV